MIVTTNPELHLMLLPDLGQPLEILLTLLTPAERALAPPLKLGRRHFALGRAAAHKALHLLVQAQDRPMEIEVLQGSQGEPQVWAGDRQVGFQVSISHSGRLAAACAWSHQVGYAAGLDLEPIRDEELGGDHYLFSTEEIAMLADSPQGSALAQLAAWTVKEAAFKALGPRQSRHPAAIQIEGLDLAAGHAQAKLGTIHIPASISRVMGPDGEYLLALAEIGRTADRDPAALMIQASQAS